MEVVTVAFIGILTVLLVFGAISAMIAAYMGALPIETIEPCNPPTNTDV